MNFAVGAHSGREGLDWLTRIRALDPHVSVVLMTAFGGVSLAPSHTRPGAIRDSRSSKASSPGGWTRVKDGRSTALR